MNKLEYLKACVIDGKIIGKVSWYIGVFSILLTDDEVNWKENTTHLRLVPKPDALYFVKNDVEGEEPTLVKIVDSKRGEKLLDVQTIIRIDSSWIPSCETPRECKIGLLLINAVAIWPSLGKKIGFVDTGKKFSVGYLEEIFASRVVNEEDYKDDKRDILVKEMIDCVDRIKFFDNLSNIFNIAATKKSITKPPELDKKKKELLIEYKDSLKDPVKVIELENRLREIDDEYLKDDPVSINTYGRKAKISRKKQFLFYGTGESLVKQDHPHVVLNSLNDGLDPSEDSLPVYANDLRFASYSRGKSTALSGYSYKVLQRSLAGINISPTPCKTTKGFIRTIDKKYVNQLVGRYLKISGKWVLISTPEQANQFIDKEVEMRSVLYCKSEKNTVCYACMSESYKHTPSGITNLAATISDILQTTFLKLMHGTIRKTSKVRMKDLIS